MLMGALNFCTQTANIWQIVGYALMVFKIVIPLLLIIFGIVDLGKAVVASDDKAIKSSTKQLAIRAISAVVIFFIPTIVGLVISLLGSAFSDEVRKDYEVCRDCITRPTASACDNAAKVLN